MHNSSLNDMTCRWDAKGGRPACGFSLLEMMMVVTVILILASISTPFYRSAVIRAREAVLREHLFTLRNLINEFTRDNGRAPLSLDEIVQKGYLGSCPPTPSPARTRPGRKRRKTSRSRPAKGRWESSTYTAARKRLRSKALRTRVGNGQESGVRSQESEVTRLD